jgi:CBS domain-containing protein
MIDLTVTEAKRFGVFSCGKLKTLGEAARIMVKEDISALVVVDDEGCLAGIITRTDLLRAYVSSLDWEAGIVGSYMNPNVVTVTPQTRLTQVAEMLLEKQIHRVVVVREEHGKLHPISVVSAADVVYHMVAVAE